MTSNFQPLFPVRRSISEGGKSYSSELSLQRRINALLVAITIAIIVLIASSSARAADRTWDGGSGSNSLWNTKQNWGGVATPVSGDSLFFGGTARLSNTNDIAANTLFNGITFNNTAGAFILSGNAVNLGVATSGSSIVNNSANLQTISLNLALQQNSIFDPGVGGVTVNGVISGAFTLTKNGGTLTLSGANTYSGGTTVSAGLLQLNNSSALGSSSGSLTVNGGVLNLNNQSVTVGNLTGSGGTIWNNLATQAVTLTIGNGNNGGGNYAGVIADRNIGGGTGTGTIALTKTGTGTITLSGANTYTGATTVGDGTLNAAATGALGGTSAITVNTGGTLLVTGTGNLNRINDSAPISLGGGGGADPIFARSGSGVVSEGIGAQRTGPLPGDVTGTSSAGLGALTLTSNATFDFGGVGVGTFVFGTFTPDGNTLTILNWTNTNANIAAQTSGMDGADDRLIFSGTPNAVDLATLVNFNGTPATFILLDTGFYEVVPVPEPNTWIGAALALAAIGFTQRKRLAKRSR